MAWFSLHGGHSGSFCRHAKGTLEDVVDAAIERGFSTYGLAEHAPRYRAVDLIPAEEDLTPAKLMAMFQAYAEKATELRELVRDRIELLVGFEAEVVPPGDYAGRMQELRESGRFDYIVGSVHYVAGRPIDLTPEGTQSVEAELGGRDELDRAYFDSVAEMVRALKPEVVGHFDLVRRFRGEDVAFADDTWPHIEAALQATLEVGGALDVNAAPARRGFGPVYPAPEILALAQRLGVPVTLGDDSHGPDSVGVGLDASLAAIREAGYTEVFCLRRTAGGIERELLPIDNIYPIDSRNL